MGTNTWEMDIPNEVIIKQALKFTEDVESKGIAKLVGAWIAQDEKLLWCYWETDKLDVLKAAFVELNKRSGLKSELRMISQFYPD
jgi:hypothetical protein